jgi:GNAT superfamily N-acetyltransferase
MDKSITYHRATSEKELRQILKLQSDNLSNILSEDHKLKEGFVTLRHDYGVLKKMNDRCAHCIAKNKDEVVGYALSMLKDFKNDVPLLIPMFNEIDKALLDQKLNLNYIAMGQVCVDKNYRGQGVFRGLYNFMKQELSSEFDTLITEVDLKNTRSSQAHKAVGFEVLKNHVSDGKNWEIIIWHWK